MNWNDIDVFSELFPATERADAEGTAETTFGKPNHQDEPADDDDSLMVMTPIQQPNSMSKWRTNESKWDEELLGGLSG